MRSAILRNGKIEIAEKEIPSLKGRKGALIRVKSCGLCGSDILKIKCTLKKDEEKVILGHEIIGEITDINVEIKDTGSGEIFKKGDIIAMGHHYPCFKCKYCIHGNFSMCDTFKKSNIYPGGFSEYIYADINHLKNTVFKKPDCLSEEEFSFLEPLACCIRAIRRAGLELNNKNNSSYNALVLGLGSIGILMAQTLKSFKVNAFGFDINKDRQSFVQKYGICFDKTIKYDLVFMTSGSSKAVDDIMNLIDRGGKIIVFSSVQNEAGYKNNDIYHKELSIIGSYSPSPYDIKTSFEFLRDGKLNLKNILTKYKLEDLNRAIKDTKEGKILKGYIKL